MSDPTPQQNPNLDEQTRLTLRVIALEESIKTFQENIALYQKHNFNVTEELRILAERVATLEAIRQKQRELNATFQTKIQSTEVKKPVWSFWK